MAPNYKDNSERDNNIIALYKKGNTLESIGNHYGITRERVRQVLLSNNISPKDGGNYIIRQQRLKERLQKQAEKEAKKELIYGMPIEKKWTLQTEYLHFLRQRSNAKARGIPWLLNFGQWWDLWEKSGHWQDMGKQKYGLGRRDLSKGFTVENCYIAHHSEIARITIKHTYKYGKVKPGRKKGLFNDN